MGRYIFSAPGRTEIGGNHTDHQHGCVLTASVDLKATARVTPNDSGVIRVKSEGYPPVVLRIDEPELRPEERNTTTALVRGVAAAFRDRGAALRGFDADVSSTVMPGSGLSSSAAFEVLLGNVMNELFMEQKLNAVEIAKIGQYAENVYFGKPCGLMDQLASSVGGLVFIDLIDPENPQVEQLSGNFAQAGLALCIIDTGADHADLTEEYAAIPRELLEICQFFGKRFLREIPEEEFYGKLPELRKAAGDRALLRALHIYGENRRVLCQREALRRGDYEQFLALVRESGLSSWRFLQNIVPAGYTVHQEVALALAMAERLLEGQGACRIHGGGFAGTIQAFVPEERLERFVSGMEGVLGAGACHVLQITSQGGRLEREEETDE